MRPRQTGPLHGRNLKKNKKNFILKLDVGCSRWYFLVVGSCWSLEVVGYWLLVNVQSQTPNNPQPQLPTASNEQKVPTAKNY
ncbi:hypothetical protein BpHYR1_041803 [Brachionus plicatilis]|uniref:Uncharacterized protein n=1 Tax=Brachionus plicatilis TaxID=10195 RepID=A0A3M7QN03_BRAPC|nr:hypothetical protein BpHYR1_041803 [Brachionus plicatilis]